MQGKKAEMSSCLHTNLQKLKQNHDLRQEANPSRMQREPYDYITNSTTKIKRNFGPSKSFSLCDVGLLVSRIQPSGDQGEYIEWPRSLGTSGFRFWVN